MTIKKRVIFVTEFTPRETKELKRLIKLTGTTKAMTIRALVRVAMKEAISSSDDGMFLFKLAKLGKL
jgi:hypothetical protein